MSEQKQPIKVVLGKPGLDGHDRGAKVLAMGLRDQGMEVIYLGKRITVETVAEAAVEEGADVVAMSCLSGAHGHHFAEVVRLLAEAGKDDVLVIGGGVIPEGDVPALKAAGVSEVFGPGTKIADVAEYIRRNVNVS